MSGPDQSGASGTWFCTQNGVKPRSQSGPANAATHASNGSVSTTSSTLRVSPGSTLTPRTQLSGREGPANS